MTRTAAALLERLLAQRYSALERSLTAGIGPEEATYRLGGRPNISWHARHVAEAIASTHEALFGERTGDHSGPSKARGPPRVMPRWAPRLRFATRLADTSDEDLPCRRKSLSSMRLRTR